MNIIMSYFCFLWLSPSGRRAKPSVQTVSFCGHIARYAQWSSPPLRFASPPFRGGARPLSANILPSTLDLWSLARARTNSKIPTISGTDLFSTFFAYKWNHGFWCKIERKNCSFCITSSAWLSILLQFDNFQLTICTVFYCKTNAFAR